LIALRVPEEEIGRIVMVVNAYPSVTHNYRRDHPYNIWFTVSEKDRKALERTLDEIRERTGISGASLLDLRTLRVFKVDVRFPLNGEEIPARSFQVKAAPAPIPLDDLDRALLRSVQEGIPLEEEPFEGIARRYGISCEEVIRRLARMKRSGIVKRIGVSLNQRRLGIVANALVVWSVPREIREEIGAALASYPDITHCYERSTVPGVWGYSIYTVHHGYDRASVEERVGSLALAHGIPDYQILFSSEQLKRTSMVHDIGGERILGNRDTECKEDTPP
jgi:Transcriptional regulators